MKFLRSTTPNRLQAVIRLTIALLSLSLVLGFLGCGKDDGADQDELWILGLDGADWDILEPMFAAGELPNLAALRDGGAWGVLRSDEPMLSPILWTSMATGKTADKHGVTWFMTDGPDGVKVPVGCYQRKVRSLWNIADEAGLESGIIGWWASWPAEHVAGWIYTDYIGSHSFGVKGSALAEGGKTWPPELVDEAWDVMLDADAASQDIIKRMVNLSAAELKDFLGASYDNDIAHLRQSIATSRGYTDLVLRRLDDQRPALMGIYYEGTDAMQHLFTDHMSPQLSWISNEDYSRYNMVVSEYWKWQDELLGELLAKRGPRTTIVVISDHGFRVGVERRKEDRFSLETADADHMIDGVIVINGPGVEVGKKIEGATVYDVTPTILYAMGLPVADDMVGRVLEDAFLPETMTNSPLTRVATYETHAMARPPMPGHDADTGQDMEQMLKSLGYIAGTSDGGSEIGESATDSAEDTPVEHVVNLATILMKQGRADEAVVELKKALEKAPGHSEVRLNLAQALARSGHAKEAESLYRGLLEEFPERLDVHQDLALFLGLEYRNKDALEIYEDGLKIDPKWVDGMAGKGLVLFKLGRAEEARRTIRDALVLDPSHHDATFYLGQIQAESNDLGGASTSLKRVLELEPGNIDAALLLADVMERQGQPNQALTMLEGLADRGHATPALNAQLGASMVANGRPADAIAVLERARNDRPEDAELMGNLGIAYAMTQRMPEAVKAFEDVARLMPQSAEAHAQLGIFYAQMNQLENAEVSLVRSIELDGSNPMAHLHLGMLMHRSDRVDRARDEYARATELAPEMAVAWYNLGMIEGAAGNNAKANEYITKARELDPSLPIPGQGR